MAVNTSAGACRRGHQHGRGEAEWEEDAEACRSREKHRSAACAPAGDLQYPRVPDFSSISEWALHLDFGGNVGVLVLKPPSVLISTLASGFLSSSKLEPRRLLPRSGRMSMISTWCLVPRAAGLGLAPLTELRHGIGNAKVAGQWSTRRKCSGGRDGRTPSCMGPR
jgi:hypothetical protein